MPLAAAAGSPRSVPGDVGHFSERFRKTNANRGALATDGTTLYSGDYRLEGKNWVRLGEGILAYATSSAVIDGDLYVSGFTRTPTPAWIIARWDGSQWTVLADDLDGPVVLTAFGTNVVAGGFFETIGGVPAKFIASWNNNAWSAFGSGPPGIVDALATYAGKLCAGSAGSSGNPGYLSCWNGSSWKKLVEGFDEDVTSLLAAGSDLYIGIESSPVGAEDIARVVRWDGSTFSELGGLESGSRLLPLWINAMVIYRGDLIVGGTTWLGERRGTLARWDGTQWLSFEVEGPVSSMVLFDSRLYLDGWMELGNGATLVGVASWNGTSFTSLGDEGSSIQAISSMRQGNGKLYAVGAFATAGGTAARSVASWDGVAWSSLGDIANGEYSSVSAVATDENDVYLGGWRLIGEANVIRWDGNAWSALGPGIDSVSTLVVHGGALYAVESGGEIKRWNGQIWSRIGTLDFGYLSATAIFDGDLYVAGQFTSVDGIETPRIARWNGSSWSAVGDGFDRFVKDLAVVNGELYAAGEFTHSGSVKIDHVARWDGEAWHDVGSEDLVDAWAVEELGGKLYAAGRGFVTGDASDQGFARWNGSKWKLLRKAPVRALAALGDQMYLAGYFERDDPFGDDFGLYSPGNCGNGVLDEGEACDPAAEVRSDCCNVSTCAIAPAATICRPPRGGCDVAETCDGTSLLCPVDLIASAGTLCRAKTDGCHLEEFCDGDGVSCPADEPSCDDGDDCNGQEACVGTICRNIGPQDCDDSDECTEDRCLDPPYGCYHGRVYSPDCSMCGDEDGDGEIEASDALTALGAAVGLYWCPLYICDVDGSGDLTTVDALRLLRAAVGLPFVDNCPDTWDGASSSLPGHER